MDHGEPGAAQEAARGATGATCRVAAIALGPDATSIRPVSAPARALHILSSPVTAMAAEAASKRLVQAMTREGLEVTKCGPATAPCRGTGSGRVAGSAPALTGRCRRHRLERPPPAQRRRDSDLRGVSRAAPPFDAPVGGGLSKRQAGGRPCRFRRRALLPLDHGRRVGRPRPLGNRHPRDTRLTPAGQLDRADRRALCGRRRGPGSLRARAEGPGPSPVWMSAGLWRQCVEFLAQLHHLHGAEEVALPPMWPDLPTATEVLGRHGNRDDRELLDCIHREINERIAGIEVGAATATSSQEPPGRARSPTCRPRLGMGRARCPALARPVRPACATRVAPQTRPARG